MEAFISNHTGGGYVLVCQTDAHRSVFQLSTLDAIRAQQQGIPYVAPAGLPDAVRTAIEGTRGVRHLVTGARLEYEGPNPNCEGGKQRKHSQGECRLLPTGGGGNMILCAACYELEMKYRLSRQQSGGDWEFPKWEELSVYVGKEN